MTPWLPPSMTVDRLMLLLEGCRFDAAVWLAIADADRSIWSPSGIITPAELGMTRETGGVLIVGSRLVATGIDRRCFDHRYLRRP